MNRQWCCNTEKKMNTTTAIALTYNRRKPIKLCIEHMPGQTGAFRDKLLVI